MKKVPLRDLKEDLSGWMARVSRGDVVQVLKYNKPYAIISPPYLSDGVLVGPEYGKGSLRAVTNVRTRGMALKYLSEDREGR